MITTTSNSFDTLSKTNTQRSQWEQFQSFTGIAPKIKTFTIGEILVTLLKKSSVDKD